MTAHWFPHLDGFWEKGGGCRSEASSGTAKHSSSLFRFGDDVCDKELEGCGEGGLGGVVQGCRSKRYGFPSSACGHTQSQRFAELEECFHTSQRTLFPFCLVEKINKFKKKTKHNHINTKRKEKVWLSSRSLSLSLAVDLEVGGRESRSTALISCPKPSVLANEKRERPSDPIPLRTDNTIILTQGLLIPRVR